ncbi:hypothetical protein [Rhizobium nepotum]
MTVSNSFLGRRTASEMQWLHRNPTVDFVAGLEKVAAMVRAAVDGLPSK